eukprot:5378503-Amphidinium_carterae.1
MVEAGYNWLNSSGGKQMQIVELAMELGMHLATQSPKAISQHLRAQWRKSAARANIIAFCCRKQTHRAAM